METDNSKRLYELIGRLFAEGRDMQALIHQLQQSLQNAQEDHDKQKAEMFSLNQALTRLQSEHSALTRKFKALTDGQEQA